MKFIMTLFFMLTLSFSYANACESVECVKKHTVVGLVGLSKTNLRAKAVGDKVSIRAKQELDVGLQYQYRKDSDWSVLGQLTFNRNIFVGLGYSF